MNDLSLVIALAVPSLAAAQSLTRENIAAILGFENGVPGKPPAGWQISGAPAEIDTLVLHGGKQAVRLGPGAAAGQGLSARVPVDFQGRTLTLRGWLKTEELSNPAILWIREDGSTLNMAAESTFGAAITGTRDWAQYTISVPLKPDAELIHFGFGTSGTGKCWLDDLELLVDGIPVAQASAVTSVFSRDHEFDQGSRVKLTSLSDHQVQNLATLAKVWGFLKYHHPAVTLGRHHWDYELFRILPAVLSAEDRATANHALSEWIGRLGLVEDCTNCAKLDSTNLALRPELGWLAGTSLLGTGLSRTLLRVHRNRLPEKR